MSDRALRDAERYGDNELIELERKRQEGEDFVLIDIYYPPDDDWIEYSYYGAFATREEATLARYEFSGAHPNLILMQMKETTPFGGPTEVELTYRSKLSLGKWYDRIGSWINQRRLARELGT